MPRLTIDNRPVDVPPGATILDAARQLGIDIPTLCHRDDVVRKGTEPLSSCFLCVVQVDGQAALTPSCSAPAADGMVVTADSPDIRDARRAALDLLLSDHVGDCLAPCTLACPAGLDIPGFLTEIIEGRLEDAAATVRARIPFGAALGRICPRFCERGCRRGDVDEPIAICALKRFAADAGLGAVGASREGHPRPGSARPPSGQRVAIVGAGPAGLSAAFYLCQQGHACTVIDAHAEPGGAFRYAVPDFRLPKDVLAREIEAITSGVEFRMNTRLGRDVALDDLRREYDAVLLAIGAEAAAPLDCPGADLATPALTFLGTGAGGRSAPAEPPPAVGSAGVVVAGDTLIAVNAARTALRAANEVTVIWPGRRGAVGVLAGQVADAEEEGVRFLFETKSTAIERVEADRLRVTAAGPDGPTKHEAAVVVAAGRATVERSALSGLDFGPTGVKVNRRTLETSLRGVFAAGEAVTGSSFGVRAVAAGRLAAVSIGRFLAGRPLTGDVQDVNVRMTRLSDVERDRLVGGVEKARRVVQQRLAAEARRRSLAEVDAPLSPEAAVRESRRCLQCTCRKVETCGLRRYATEYGADPNAFRGARREYERESTHDEIVYEPGKCILCGLCVRIAEEAREELGLAFVGRGFQVRAAVPFGEGVKEGLRRAAARCAEACPTGAIAPATPRRPSHA